MPNFKPKATRNFKISKKYSVTLDNKHNEKMKEFHIIQKKKIPALKKEKKKMEEKIKEAENTEERLEFEDKLKGYV